VCQQRYTPNNVGARLAPIDIHRAFGLNRRRGCEPHPHMTQNPNLAPVCCSAGAFRCVVLIASTTYVTMVMVKRCDARHTECVEASLFWVADDAAGAVVLGGPGRREAARRSVVAAGVCLERP
jgi:hypothetical protein